MDIRFFAVLLGVPAVNDEVFWARSKFDCWRTADPFVVASHAQ
jgi:hypothetical protein